jgi:pantoate--beta-alanine ligase
MNIALRMDRHGTKGFDSTVEGQARPGHFRGVATIVTKLFNIVRPDRAYFGQKDAAQCVLIRRLVQDLDMGIEIHIANTVREADGLAMSSRNAYLSPQERSAAPIIYRSLQSALDMYDRQSSDMPIPSSTLQDTVRNILQSEPMVHEIQYISIDSRETMQSLPYVTVFEGAIISIACKIGTVRLIDNVVLSPKSQRRE